MPGQKVTYTQALNDARNRLTKVIRNKQSAFREAEAILLHAAKITREKLYVSLRDVMPIAALKQFVNMTALRLKNVPLQYITGSECFYGREFRVAKGVFIPRPDTEALIDAVLSIRNNLPGSTAADCGSGSGILSVTILKEVDAISRFHCFDPNKKALDLTLENALTHGVSRNVKLHKGDFFALCKRQRMKFDLLVSNPPYIRLKAMKTLQKEVLKEPAAALTDGGGGYSFYKKFAETGSSILNPGGFVVMEIGDNMGKRVRRFFESRVNVQKFKGSKVQKLKEGRDHKWVFAGSFKDFRDKERVLVFRLV